MISVRSVPIHLEDGHVTNFEFDRRMHPRLLADPGDSAGTAKRLFPVRALATPIRTEN